MPHIAVNESFKRGTVELLILTLLDEEEKYGYQISQELAERSGGRYTLLESSMYPILYRMLEKGLIADRTELVGRRRTRVYYRIEPAGKEYLAFLRKEYTSLTRGVLDILGIHDLAALDKNA